mmetsp:Transcript_44790/g.74753  ORF Transcript_44790/g.74753 Transcript_44790/m.74753 type:complete len:131 (+) Transcript_44790:740-1132(+)
MFYGWKYAAGIVGLIYIHEAGHAIAMVRHDIKVGGMLFIPFMGAAVSMDSKPKDPYVNAYVALAGPVCGTMGALIPFGFALTTGSQMAFALADFGLCVVVIITLMTSSNGYSVCCSVSYYVHVITLPKFK